MTQVTLTSTPTRGHHSRTSSPSCKMSAAKTKTLACLPRTSSKEKKHLQIPEQDRVAVEWQGRNADQRLDCGIKAQGQLSC
jgi:hypothetical protein